MNLEIIQYLPEKMTFLMVAAYILGIFLKRTPKIADWTIPWILLVVCELGSFGINVIGQPMSGELIVNSACLGMICAGVPVLVNQLKIQGPKRDMEKVDGGAQG